MACQLSLNKPFKEGCGVHVHLHVITKTFFLYTIINFTCKTSFVHKKIYGLKISVMILKSRRKTESSIPELRISIAVCLCGGVNWYLSCALHYAETYVEGRRREKRGEEGNDRREGSE